MKINFYKKRLYEMLNDLYTITGISTSIYNLKNEVAYCNSSFPDYCAAVRSTSKGIENCIFLNKNGCDAAASLHKPITYCCHAGLCETIVPIYYGNVHVGYFVIGQYIDKEQYYATDVALEKCCRDYNLDYETMKGYKKKLCRLDNEQLNSFIRLSTILIDYIVFHKLMVPDNEDITAGIIEYINENYMKELTVDLLCHTFLISRSNLYALFKELNASPHEYIMDIRLKKAKSLLLNTNKPLSEISELVGFDNYNYFIRVFRKIYNITPNKYRLDKRNP